MESSKGIDCDVCGFVDDESTAQHEASLKHKCNSVMKDFNHQSVSVLKQQTDRCKVCGILDNDYDEGSPAQHNFSEKHKCNIKLEQYQKKKDEFKKNKHVVNITCSAESETLGDECGTVQKPTDHHKIRIFVKPKQIVKFSFTIKNESDEDLIFHGIQMAHPQPQFVMNDHRFVFDKDPHIFKKKSTIQDEVSVKFEANDIGQFEMPIMFTFRNENNKQYLFIREMVVMIQTMDDGKYVKSPFDNKLWDKADRFIRSRKGPAVHNFKIPKDLKTILALGFHEDSFDRLNVGEDTKRQLRESMIRVKAILATGITKDNYINFFSILLWWDEVILKINLRKYNMVGVTLQKESNVYLLEVPGLAEKRPSVLRGDRILIRPSVQQMPTEQQTTTVQQKKTVQPTLIFEFIVKKVNDSVVHLSEMDPLFNAHYRPEKLFDVRFLLSRVIQERAHGALSTVLDKHEARLFPKLAQRKVKTKPITKFYNKLIEKNKEQKSAVEHIVSSTSGTAPYIVFGPPGTGKTMTIVEAIIQVVVHDPTSRVLVCTESNMAADHIALMLFKYNDQLNINNFIFRASSQTREWSVLPPALAPVSNGTCIKNFYSVDNAQLATYRVVVTTLLHSAKFSTAEKQKKCRLEMSHLFIDEAAQASEPVSLAPLAGLLAPRGLLVLAGDPKQLGPVCMSKDAKNKGLGISLLERLVDSCPIYKSDPNYITMLIENYRSDPDILCLPNILYYGNKLKPLAAFDPLSRKSILGLPGGERAIVFHGVNSREQRMKNTPSFFNEREIEMIQRYVRSLINTHNVLPEDIGIVTPYIRQVYKIKAWLLSEEYDKVDIGTVEAFQGKEKRVILVSTVRANCRLLEYDAKYDLGFLVEDKRFNVTITRAKAKLVIIGNPNCLTRDQKWRMYLNLCRELGTYHGQETEQLERTTSLLVDIAKTRFDRCLLTQALKEIELKETGREKSVSV